MSTRSFHCSLFVCVVAALLIICKPAIGQTYDSRPIETFAGDRVIANEVLVQFKAAVAEKSGTMTSAQASKSEQTSLAEIDRSFGIASAQKIGNAGWYLVRSRDAAAGVLVRGIRVRSDVMYVEPDYLLTQATDSVAQYYAPDQWALKNTGQTIDGPAGSHTGSVGADISASLVWNLTTGLRNSVIATIDPTGIDYTHPDLSPN